MILYFLLILCAVNISGVIEGDSCVKGGITGVCTNIRKCPDAQQDIQNRNAPQLCEFGGIDPVVCCISAPALDTSAEFPCTTADGRGGECVAYHLCDSNNYIITNGVGFIDIRTRSKRDTKDTLVKERMREKRAADPTSKRCQSLDETCCVLPVKSKAPPQTSTADHKPGSCGWRNPNGVDSKYTAPIEGKSKFGEFPWTIAIVIRSTINDGDQSMQINEYAGGGTLIHPSIVLTAAHFTIAQENMRARAGEWHTQRTSELYPFQDRDVDSVVAHPDFQDGSLIYDIALLFLSSPMELAPNVGLACLPPPREVVPAGTRCFASGWGKDKLGKGGSYQRVLKKVDLPVIDREACQAALRQTRLSRFFELHTTFMCAGGELDKDMCEGDGGSALSCPIENQDRRYMQSGIVAWGIGCGGEAIPGVYVDVSYLRYWIDYTVVTKGYDPKTYTI